jgi:hypothetical protein
VASGGPQAASRPALASLAIRSPPPVVQVDKPTAHSVSIRSAFGHPHSVKEWSECASKEWEASAIPPFMSL